ncbi:MAG: hypothetical protein IJ137_09985 [Eubacterium sp.]|nr:hypothetical protein [Eubacterium sp.]
MALQNTSDRYKYIYGNTARQLAAPEPAYPAVRRKPADSRRSDTAGRTAREAQRRARARRQAEHVIDFDWKYTVVVTIAAFVLMMCAILYVKGTIHLHSLSTQVTQLKEEKASLISKQTALKTEIDKAINLDEIRSYAVKKKGMVYPGQKHIIYYNDNNSDYFRQFESIDIK